MSTHDVSGEKRDESGKWTAGGKAVSVREAQDAAQKLGPSKTDEIVGPGGLSGATPEALKRLVAEATKKAGSKIASKAPVQKPVTIREAQDAAMKLGDARTAEIVGPGGLSGAAPEALRRLVDEAAEQLDYAKTADEDPTLAFLRDLDDESKYLRRDNVPVFAPHRAKKKGADGKLMDVEVGEDDLHAIAANNNAREDSSGTLALVTLGHRLRDPAAPEAEQPVPVGYARNWAVGTFGPGKLPCLLCTEYIERGRLADLKSFPFRSAEYYPGRREITGVAHLRRDPQLDLGMVTYRGELCLAYSAETNMPDMPADPTAPPDAAVTPEPAPAPEPDGDEANDKAFEAAHYGHPGAAAYYQRKCAQYAAPAMPGATNVAAPGEPAPEPFARGEQAAHYARLEADNRELRKKAADKTALEREVATLRRDMAAVQRDKRKLEYRGLMTQYARDKEIRLDVDRELSRKFRGVAVVDFSPEEFNAYLETVGDVAHYDRGPLDAPVGGDFLPAAKPARGGKKELDEARLSEAHQYMLDHQCSMAEAVKQVVGAA